MKNKILLLIFMILLIPINVFAADECDPTSVKIESVELNDTRGNVEENNNPTSNNNNLNLDLNMNVPGDSIEYKLTLKNTSEEDYYFDENSLIKNMDNVEYEFSYSDGDNIVKSGEEKIVILKVTYKDKVAADQLDNGVMSQNNTVTLNLTNNSLNVPDTLKNRSVLLIFGVILIIISGIMMIINEKRSSTLLLLLGVSISLIPITVHALCKCELNINSKIEINGMEAEFLPGKEVSVKMKLLAGDDLSGVTNGYSFENTSIVAVKYSQNEPDSSNKEDKNIVSIPESLYPIYMWFDNGTIYWWSEDETPSLNEDASYMFGALTSLSDISGLEKMDVSNTEILSSIFLYSGLTDVNYLQKWKTSNVTIMKDIFFNNKSLINLEGLRNWDISSVDNIYRAFASNLSLQSLNGLETWDVSNVTNMSYVFSQCKELVDISALENWDTSNVENISFLLGSCKELVDVSALKYWNVEKVSNMKGLFNSCWHIDEIDFSNWSTKSLTNASNMFGMSYDAQGNTGGDIKKIILSDKFDTSKVTDMSYMFYNNNHFEDYNFLDYIDTSSVTNMEGMFCKNSKLTNLEKLSRWDVSNVTSFNFMFSDSSNITDTSAIKDWNIRRDATFEHMFHNGVVPPEFTNVTGTWNRGTFTPD